MNRKMMMTVAAASVIVPTTLVFGGAHTWDIVEVFSTPDGLIQFIELREMNGTANEWHTGGLHVKALPQGGDLTLTNLAAPSTNKRLLLATAGFQALTNAPAPDFIIPANFFNPVGGDTFSYHTYDSWVVSTGQIPQDCLNSWNRSGASGVSAGPTPTNYAGQGPAGPIDYCPPPPPECPADMTDSGGGEADGQVNVFDLFVLLGNWSTNGQGADLAPDNSIVDVFDLFVLLSAWGDCD